MVWCYQGVSTVASSIVPYAGHSAYSGDFLPAAKERMQPSVLHSNPTALGQTI